MNSKSTEIHLIDYEIATDTFTQHQVGPFTDLLNFIDLKAVSLTEVKALVETSTDEYSKISFVFSSNDVVYDKLNQVTFPFTPEEINGQIRVGATSDQLYFYGLSVGFCQSSDSDCSTADSGYQPYVGYVVKDVSEEISLGP